ncbi:MAG: transcriptional regulator, partial [Betaproteobacteria bacterium]|nr:transcriptional regulator [Betaproteobacteria bacterium]
HLSTLFQAGILQKRRDGVQIYYSIANPGFVDLCRAVCTQIATESLESV